MQTVSTCKNGLNNHQQHQKVISILLIMLMSVLPMLSASASLFQCQHMSNQGSTSTTTSLTSTMSGKITETMTKTITGDLHDCCEEANLQCDCDNGHASFSLVNAFASEIQSHSISTFKPVIQPLLISKIVDSLYRPPISIL